jgi:PleD family two-component response regulator
VRASFGVAQWRPEENASAWFQRTDQCIYAAKESGRNQVVCSDP